jgi:hypothetical protein
VYDNMSAQQLFDEMLERIVFDEMFAQQMFAKMIAHQVSSYMPIIDDPPVWTYIERVPKS